ncbi:hypothetical protein C6495_13555 [Candidatus Poribacteria bacterium]|nr:MAG: hypothetical protein C6495_13555 [Candidatus Poribacteria bacterium]
MAGTVCSNCNVGWEIFAHEPYCGYCGCSTFGFSVRWKETPLFYGSASATREATLLVENTGSCPMTFQPLQTKHQLVDAAYAQPFKVNAGQSVAIAIRVDAAKLTLQPENIRVQVQEPLTNLKGEPLRLRALPEPAFKLLPNPIMARYRKGTETMNLELQVEVTRSQFDISRVKFSQEKIKSVNFMKGRYKEGDAAKRVRLAVDCEKLRDGVNEETLEFYLRGLAEPIAQTVRIQAEVEPEPPKLFVPKATLEITQERERTHTLTLQNQGESPLKIQEIDIESPPGLVRLPDVKYPIEIEGGSHKNVELSISGIGIEPGSYPSWFTITSNCETSPRYRDELLNVTVKQLEAYPHYVAIDFGTTNSCCAYIDVDTYQPKLIPLRGAAGSPEIMPSSIVYHSRPATEASYSVGTAAEDFRTSGTDSPYYITSVKRWLGYQWHRQFPRELALQPLDVAADILKYIVAEAEAHLDTLTSQSKITRCVVTYPTMFTRQQREELRLAFEKIGITELILIDEASAASIGTIFQQREEPLRDNSKLMVYDFGGGTIDIVLSQVTNTGSEILIEPLVRGGNPKYGGDDVTQAIVDFILNECGKQIRDVNPGIRFDIPYLKRRKILQPSGNPAVDRASRENAFVYDAAEEMKRELSEKSAVTSRFLGYLQVKIGDSVSTLEGLLRQQQTRTVPHTETLETPTQREITVELSQAQLQTLIQPELNQTFAAIDEMLADCGSAPPDIVVLAGQSSKMPLVKEMMEAHFQKKYQTRVDIHLAEHPKACVVIGAAQYGLYQTMPGEGRISPVNMERTRARLGIVKLSWGKRVFDEIIPQGKLIPDESVETTDFPLPAGTTFVDVREHFGTANDLGETSQVASYTLELPEDVPRAALRKARLKMAVKASGEIELIALVDGQAYKSTVQHVSPAFVDEI